MKMPDRGIGRKERKGHKVEKSKMHREGLLSRASLSCGDGVDLGLIGIEVLECDVVAALGRSLALWQPISPASVMRIFVGSLIGGFNSLESLGQSQ